MTLTVVYETVIAVWALSCGCIQADIQVPDIDEIRARTEHPLRPTPGTYTDAHLILNASGRPVAHPHGDRVHQILTRPGAKPPKRTDLILRPRDAAKRMRTTDKQLARWADLGYLTVRRTPGGHRRYSASEINEWVAADGVALFQAPRRHPIPTEVAGQLAVPNGSGTVRQ